MAKGKHNNYLYDKNIQANRNGLVVNGGDLEMRGSGFE